MDYREYFISKWPEEAVGYLKDGEFYPLENIAEDKLHSFEVDPAFLLEEPDALLHSHCTAVEVQQHDPHEPSYEDLQGQIATAIEWGICVTDGQTCEDPLWWGNPRNRPPLLDRTFIFNIQDCFCLVQDWYYQERGIELPNLARTWDWNLEGNNYLEEKYKEWGFEDVALQDLKEGDVLFYQVRSPVPNHLSIYLGNNKVLSHWYGRLSCIEDFGVWAKYCVKGARYTNDNSTST